MGPLLDIGASRGKNAPETDQRGCRIVPSALVYAKQPIDVSAYYRQCHLGRQNGTLGSPKVGGQISHAIFRKLEWPSKGLEA